MNYDQFLCALLKTIDDSLGKDNVDLNTIFNHKTYNLEESRYDLFLENAVDDGFLKGVTIRGRSVALANPRLTSYGLRHLENNCKA